MKHLSQFLALIFCAFEATPACRLTVHTFEMGSPTPIPARVSVWDANRAPVAPSDDSPFWNGYAASNGAIAYTLTPGEYTLWVERGPEWRAFESTVQITTSEAERTIQVNLERLADLSAEGWVSGESHIHRDYRNASRLLAANDLDVGQFITWWNQTNNWTPTLGDGLLSFPDGRSAFATGGEDERDGGALLFGDLAAPINITDGQRHYPSSILFAQQAKAQGAWIDIEKPFWWDLPMWIAHDIGDTIGIANNHLYRKGGLYNEAWGRPRDLDRFPGPRGNGLWTQEIYFHLLNCGIRIPPSAGSASGVLPNPVGYNRVYAHTDGISSYKSWLDSLKAGRVFVTNGPLLRVRANGRLPGAIFRPESQSISIPLDTRLDSNEFIDSLEVIVNGEARPMPANDALVMNESGWFSVRAITQKPGSLGFAMTGPFYVEFDDAPLNPRQEASARFFTQWVSDRINILNANTDVSDSQRAEIRQPWETARTFWQTKVEEAQEKYHVQAAIFDAATKDALPARVYLKEKEGDWLFVEPQESNQSSQTYEKRNWNNSNAEEFHTTLTAGGFQARLTAGEYSLTVERGKEYKPYHQTLQVTDSPIQLEIPLERWVNMAERGWYSGDTHVHRTLEELPNLLQVEDLNVAFPLTYWVTRGFQAPAVGDKTTGGEIPESLIRVDDTHVIWPRNTEWEIFTINGQRHTLGAVFALGHQTPFTLGAPPVKPIAQAAREQGALLDLDKHDWPWSMTLPSSMGVQLYELANNHIWRTEFGFTSWNSPTPPWMRPPLKPQSGNEREWILYTMENYYTLLNCGYTMVPTAGTASGVHPVPLGFGRVYVHLPNGFNYQDWKTGLERGRSFVTTGPMILATANRADPGATFSSEDPVTVALEGEIISETPLTFAEVIQDGIPTHTIFPRDVRRENGAYITPIDASLTSERSGWIAIRAWEDRPNNRLRYAHTAPWLITVNDQPRRPRDEERDYIAQRIRTQIERSQDILPNSAIEEYRDSLDHIEALPVKSSDNASQRRPGTATETKEWLRTMLEHNYADNEIQSVIDIDNETIASARAAWTQSEASDALRIAPYPGGRHPRIGFLEGAIAPQRETKFSVFAPWDPQSYFVVDLPEAIWSNLGLTYLAHTHIDTIWDQRGIQLEPQEWLRHSDGSLSHERNLPNGIAFGARVRPKEKSVKMELWFRNGTDDALTDLRVQNCVMLKGATGFSAQSNANREGQGPVAIARSEDHERYFLTAWQGAHRTWANAPVPCIHADPKFPDLQPGDSATLKGELWLVSASEFQSTLKDLTERFTPE